VFGPRAMSTTERDPAGKRRNVTFFVSYAHANEAACRELVDLLTVRLEISRSYCHRLWGDWQILPGELWLARIRQALRDCDFGLLLISPEFLGSEFITREELQAFFLGAKPLIPVMVERVNLRRHDLKGLAVDQLFMWQSKPGSKKLTFGDCAHRQQRLRFADSLFEQIEERLDGHYGIEW
jgi:TIR domain